MLKFNVLGAEEALDGYAGRTGFAAHFQMASAGVVFSVGESEEVWKHAQLLNLDIRRFKYLIVPSCLSEYSGGLGSFPGEDEICTFTHPHIVLSGVVSEENIGNSTLITRDTLTMITDDVWLLGDLPEGAGPDGEMWGVVVVDDELVVLSAGLTSGIKPLASRVQHYFPEMPMSFVGSLRGIEIEESECPAFIEEYRIKGFYPLMKDSIPEYFQKQEIQCQCIRAGETLEFGRTA